MKKFVLIILCFTFLSFSLKAVSVENLPDNINLETSVSKSENINNKDETQIDKTVKAKKTKHYRMKKTLNRSEDKITLTCPECNFPQIVEDYYNSIDGLKFENYPNTGWFYYTGKTYGNVNGYYNMIDIKKDSFTYEKNSHWVSGAIVYNSNDTALSKILEFMPENTIAQFIDEDVRIENGTIIFRLNEVYNTFNGYRHHIRFNKKSQNPDLLKVVRTTNSANKFFEKINSSSDCLFVNYPDSFMLNVVEYQEDENSKNRGRKKYNKVNNELIIYKNGKKIKTVKLNNEYEVIFPDKDSIIDDFLSELLADNSNYKIDISFSDTNSIIIKKDNYSYWHNLYGIIDRNGKIKTPLNYNFIYYISGGIKEELQKKTSNHDTITLKYIRKTNVPNMFIALIMDDLWRSCSILNVSKYIIDDKNNVILKIDPFLSEDKIDNKIINKKIKKRAFAETRRERAISNIQTILEIPLLPFELLLFWIAWRNM